MYEIGVEELHRLFVESRCAAKYAREHYNSLASRKHTYTLYGPDAYGIGASVPSKMVPVKARKLLKTTHRKNYLAYQLDDQYRILRTVHVLNYSQVDCTYHHFELDGVSYAYPYKGDTGERYSDAIYVLKYVNGMPTCYAVGYNNLLFAQFYEYPSQEKMIVSTYRYWPTAQVTMHGCSVDRNARIGAPNSPVQYHCTEEVPAYIDFSHWLK